MVFANSRSPLLLVSHILSQEVLCSYKICAEDELVSLDDLQEKIGEFEDYVQSSDVAAMQSKRSYLIAWIGSLTSYPRAVNCGVRWLQRVIIGGG